MRPLCFLPAAAPLLAVALTGCGLTSSPADALTFKPPAGWHSSPGIMGFMQFWKPPDGTDEVLMLFKSPRPLQTKDVFVNAQMKDAVIEQRRSVTICGNQPATYMRARGESKGHDADVQMMASNLNGTTYFAMYVHPSGSPPNPQAAAAIRELCTKT